MKFIKWKTLILTTVICLLPILLGLAMWNILPDRIAIHFNINNEPDNFASKEFAVFGLPILMAFLQIFCTITNDYTSRKHNVNKKIEKLTTWIIPAMSVVLQTITLGYSVGWEIDIRKIVILIIAVIFLLTGAFLPKSDYVKNRKINSEKARKINKFMGFETVIMGILALITLFLPPVFTIIWLFLFIPYTILGILYQIKVSKEK